MYQEQRMSAIVEYLHTHRTITLDEICDMFTVSKDTARRDLVKLEENGEVMRVKGGATLSSSHIIDYSERTPTKAKEQIAKEAASLISKGYDVLLDTSSTIALMAKYMDVKHVTVITNSIDNVDLLDQYTACDTFLLPGKFNGKNRNVTGSRTISTLQEYKVDQLFLGTCGVGADGITSPSEEEAFLKRQMIQCARQVIMLADHTKFEREFLHRVCDMSDIDILITNKAPEADVREKIEQNQVRLIVTDFDKGEETQ
ncbi:transcriptional regulator, DeoR family [Priestia megaterium]|uniref:DeoR/GlpR family DNA-binding transcription regulator n=1 Tax=Priestia megaterium TaxID=1404 RepID=UPI0008F2009F|nr:transcriptional regulator, DeoR family [Priestia megaterium]